VIIGTAGHIDHGKTALVKALTGVDADRLPEEKRRGITIDLGFAPLFLEGVGTVGVIDVPGHEDFVRSMLVGASGIDLGLLVVAADEGVMPQTREHLLILELLRIPQVVVAVTKSDLVDDEWMELVRADALALFNDSPLATPPVVSCSSRTSAGLDELRSVLAKCLANAKPRASDDLFRMPVDRAFSVKGTGTVATGTVWSGELPVEASLVVLPSGKTARARRIEQHGNSADVARAGGRAAIALAGLDAETGVVMLLYLDHAWEKFRGEGRMNNTRDLHDAVIEGAVGRVRPKIMTVSAILFGLLPIMWSPVTQAGADVMKRITAPMIGGVVTSALLELLIYPVIHVFWRRRELEDQTEAEAPLIPSELVPSERMRQRLPKIIALTVAIVLILFGGKFVWQKIAASKAAVVQGTPIATQAINDLTVKLYGQARKGPSELLIEFRDANDQLVDVGDVKMDANMNMPGMQMHSGATVERTKPAGQYRAKIKPDMAGDWMAKLSFQGPRGNGQTTFNLNVKQ